MNNRIFDSSFLFFFNDTATTEIYTLSLHDALPISRRSPAPRHGSRAGRGRGGGSGTALAAPPGEAALPAGRGGTGLSRRSRPDRIGVSPLYGSVAVRARLS